MVLVLMYSKTPIYRGQLFPQIRLNMHIVNKQIPDLPRTPIYRGCFLSPKTRGKSGFYCIMVFRSYTRGHTQSTLNCLYSRW